jgi:hypothetical protein
VLKSCYDFGQRQHLSCLCIIVGVLLWLYCILNCSPIVLTSQKKKKVEKKKSFVFVGVLNVPSRAAVWLLSKSDRNCLCGFPVSVTVIV